MKIYFENCGAFITAAHDHGEIIVRCGFSLTDCRDTESLGSFVARHGGEVEAAQYLRECYADS